MIGQIQRARIAEQTVQILEQGGYAAPSGREVDLSSATAYARAKSVLHRPEDFESLFRQRDEILNASRYPREGTRFEVTNETTLSAARRLLSDDAVADPLCLNFASARHPGGGFLNGASAQEESLARATALYTCIAPQVEMYQANWAYESALYLDHMIYSPLVPVFRDDEDDLLEHFFYVSILTAPAVNAGAVRHNERNNAPRIGPTMRSRIEKLLTVAVIHGHEELVLGAWGCGVFGNDPADVARWFREQLEKGSRFHGAFRRVIFAVLDGTSGGRFIRPFQEAFSHM